MKMKRMLGTAALVLCVTASGLHAQTADGRDQLISANPFGLLLELFNAEYERVIATSATAGIGGSLYTDDEDTYLNADVFARFYLNGDPFRGLALGGKVGITSFDGSTYPGFGFDANYSWLFGAEENFYVGIGFGLKRLLGTETDDPDDDEPIGIIPTFRLVNVGFRF